MKTIVIVGATGQVGTELALILSAIDDVRVIAVCRSRLAAALLLRCQVECRIGDPGDPSRTAALLEGADVLVDLALPAGPEPQVRRANLALVRTLMAQMPPGCAYVFASTYMVIGMRDPGDSFRWRMFAGTAYGARKRVLEREVRRLGRRASRDVFIFRFGQVHGELQRVTRSLVDGMSKFPVLIPSGPSNTVFVSSIVEGVAGVARGTEEPGTYSLVSNPQMSWADMHGFLARTAGVDQPVRVEGRSRASLRQRVRGLVLSWAVAHREVLVGYVLPRIPDREVRLRGQHLVRSARTAIALEGIQGSPFAYAFDGDAGGKLLRTPTDPRDTAAGYAHLVRRILGAALS